jgi:hypothetical protein
MDSMNIVMWKQGTDERLFPCMMARLPDVAGEFYFSILQMY